jgi:hypothetical protein
LTLPCLVIIQADRGYDIGVACRLILPNTIANPSSSSDSENNHENVTKSGNGSYDEILPSGKIIRKILSIIPNDDKYIKYMLQMKLLSERDAVKMAITICSELKVGPTVNILSVEFQADRKKLTVYYRKSADVSLCKLIRKLHSAFKMRIWMENIDTLLNGSPLDGGYEKDQNIEIDDQMIIDIFHKREERYLELGSFDMSEIETGKSYEGGNRTGVGFLPTQQCDLSQQLSHLDQSNDIGSLPFLRSLPTPQMPTHSIDPMSYADQMKSVPRSEYPLRGGGGGGGELNHHLGQYSTLHHHQRPAIQPKRYSLPHRPPPPQGYSDYLPQPPPSRNYLNNSQYQTQRSLQAPHTHRPVYQATQSYQRSAYRSSAEHDLYHAPTGGVPRDPIIQDYSNQRYYSGAYETERFLPNSRMENTSSRGPGALDPYPPYQGGRGGQREFSRTIAPALSFPENMNPSIYEPSIDDIRSLPREYSPANPSFPTRGTTPSSIYDWKEISSLSPSQVATNTPVSDRNPESYHFEGSQNEFEPPRYSFQPSAGLQSAHTSGDSYFYASQIPSAFTSSSSSTLSQQQQHQPRQIQSEYHHPLYPTELGSDSSPLPYRLRDDPSLGFETTNYSYHYQGK